MINVDIWLNRSVTLSMAETERYDIVLFSRVASLTGSLQTSNELCESKIAGKLWPGPRRFFSGVKTRLGRSPPTVWLYIQERTDRIDWFIKFTLLNIQIQKDDLKHYEKFSFVSNWVGYSHTLHEKRISKTLCLGCWYIVPSLAP